MSEDDVKASPVQKETNWPKALAIVAIAAFWLGAINHVFTTDIVPITITSQQIGQVLASILITIFFLLVIFSVRERWL